METELRLGNYISNPAGYQVQVTHLSFDEDFTEMIKHHKGIPITPEWLEKFGFKKEVSESYASGNSITFDVYRKDKLTYNTIQNQWWYGPVLDAPLRYVHQLQNLYFALTGQELTQI